MARGNCRCCKNEYSINADGTIRYHLAADPECQDPEDANSRKCRGAGQPPAEVEEATPGFVCRIPAGPTGCGRPVELTANGRARSHLDNAGHSCVGGSDWPLEVAADGTRRDTSPKGEVLPAAAPEDLRFGSEDPVEDFLGTGGPTMAERVEAAGDSRTAAQQAETDPVDSVLAGLMGAEPDGLGTVADVLGFDPQDPDGPGQPLSDEQFAEAITRRENPGAAEIARIKTLPPEERAAPADALFDTTHRITDESGVDWTHPGQAAECSLPECCTHPEGFTYVDDDNGHSGSFCAACGAEEPEPCTHPGGHVYGGTDEDGDDVWACETCGEREDPAVTRDRARCTVGDLDEGVLFVRHTRPEPVGSLVYRAGAPAMGPLEATVVSAGPYGGRTGSLTDMTEEVTCTDLDGKPRPRRSASATRTTAPTSRPQRSSSPAATSPTTPATAPSSKPSTTAESAPLSPVSEAEASGPGTPSGPTAKAATSTVSAPMTSDAQAAADFLGSASGSHGEAEAKYGRWGRYKLRHPATGKTVEWTRCTTFAKSISDTFTLSQWGKRNVIVGATMRPDIIAAAAGKDVSDDREQLNNWAEELEQAAGSKVAANLGTAVHSWTERVDRNWARRWEVFETEVPGDFKPQVRAYIELLEYAGLEPVASLIEFSTAVLQYEVMGTSDNCYRTTKHLTLSMPRGEVRLSPGEFVIGDKKSGKDLSYGWQEIAIQLSIYGKGLNSLGRYDWGTDSWEKDPLAAYGEPGTKVREDVGIILHLPVDPRSTKKPALHGVDLEQGWNAAVLCERVRAWRKLRTLAGQVAVSAADDLAREDAAPVRPPTLRERAEAVTSKAEASSVYQAAVAAKVPVAELKELIALMSEKVARVAEPGGAKV